MATMWLIAGAAALAAAAFVTGVGQKKEREDDLIPEERESLQGADEQAADDGESGNEDIQQADTQFVRATIRTVKRDMHPLKLQSWTRIVCDCEDGVERAMSFDGENGIHLAAGDTGILEHRDDVFVSFEKESGEVVAVLYHIPAEEQ